MPLWLTGNLQGTKVLIGPFHSNGALQNAAMEYQLEDSQNLTVSATSPNSAQMLATRLQAKLIYKGKEGGEDTMEYQTSQSRDYEYSSSQPDIPGSIQREKQSVGSAGGRTATKVKNAIKTFLQS